MGPRLCWATSRPITAQFWSQRFDPLLCSVLRGCQEVEQAALADVIAVRERDPACTAYSSALLYYKGYHALQTHRIAHGLWERGQTVLARSLQVVSPSFPSPVSLSSPPPSSTAPPPSPSPACSTFSMHFVFKLRFAFCNGSWAELTWADLLGVAYANCWVHVICISFVLRPLYLLLLKTVPHFHIHEPTALTSLLHKDSDSCMSCIGLSNDASSNLHGKLRLKPLVL